jgi:exodeoxyribonuclease-3
MERKEKMKFVSWNVAGYRACLKKGFAEFFEKVDADIFALQEVKATEEQIDYIPDGYICYRNVAFKKGYSGTIIYTKVKPLSVRYGMNIPMHDEEGRMITLEYEDFYFINTYVPNVKRTLERLDYRMQWEDDFRKYVGKLKQEKMVIICGDFNVAHQEIDIKNAKANRGNAGFTDEEREKFSELLESGFIDSFRYQHPTEKDWYTWWSYIKNVREKNIGWRIDYFLVSKEYIHQVKNTTIYREVLGSDHCPIGLEISYEEN